MLFGVGFAVCSSSTASRAQVAWQMQRASLVVPSLPCCSQLCWGTEFVSWLAVF